MIFIYRLRIARNIWFKKIKQIICSAAHVFRLNIIRLELKNAANDFNTKFKRKSNKNKTKKNLI